MDALEEWQQALAEVEGTDLHLHAWFRCTEIGGRVVYHCGCGERRLVPLGSPLSPDDVPSGIVPGGSIANVLETIDLLH